MYMSTKIVKILLINYKSSKYMPYKMMKYAAKMLIVNKKQNNNLAETDILGRFDAICVFWQNMLT